MSTADTLRSINCTACGAGLSVLGGGRVAARACDYCGALLDAQDDYRILETYRDLPRPDSPFAIGMTGQLQGVAWTVIGTLAVFEEWKGKRWDWVEHQLYSPTHGYCWLAVEDGHVTFTRKVRGLGKTGWWSEARVNQAENQPVTWWQGERFLYFESGTREIGFAEGSFNFTPRRGQRTPFVTFMSETRQLTHALEGPEREIELTSYVEPADLASGFDLPEPPVPRGLHALQPFRPWPHGKFLRNAGFASAGLGLLLWLMLLGSAQMVLDERDVPTTRPQSLDFEVRNARDLVRIEVTSNASNSWAWYDLELLDREGETVTEFGRLTEYYFGREDGEDWSEGSRTARATLRLPEPGRYTLAFEQTEAGTWSNGLRPTTVRVTVEEGVKAASWMLFAALLSAGAGALVLGRRFFHHTRRWADSDWSDED